MHQADCITLDPYLGENALLPFVKEKGKGIFVVCRSSNPRSSDLQGLIVSGRSEEVQMEANKEVFMRVACMCDSVRRQSGKRKHINYSSIQYHRRVWSFDNPKYASDRSLAQGPERLETS